MGVMRVLGPEGDIVVSWNPSDEGSTVKARGEFDRLRAGGYEFFDTVGDTSKRLTAFDPDAGELLAAPGVKRPEDVREGKRERAMAGGPNDRVVLW